MRKTKTYLALLMAVMMMGSSLAGCGLSSDDGNSTKNNDEKTSDNQTADADSYINCILNGEPSTLDIAKFTQVYDRTVMQNMLEPLTRVQDGEVVAAGAKEWTVSDDGLIYTFTLQDNHWSDGEPVTSEDYLYALQREADPVNAWPMAADMYSIANFEDIFSGNADVSQLGVEAPDDKTLVITLATPDSSFLSNVDLFPCRKDYVEKYGDSYGSDADKVISCGPFALKEWVHDSSLTFEKNEEYWDKDSVQLSKFTFYVMNDTNARMSSFENGSLDYVNVSNSEYIQKFSSDNSLVSEPVSAGRTFMIVFNCEDEVFANEKIRLAFSLALDRETMAEIITGGTGVAATGLIPPESSVGTYNFRKEAGDVVGKLQKENTDLKALLLEGMKEAGLGTDPSALNIKFSWGATTADARTYSELVQKMWKDTLGVNVELEFNDTATHMSNINSGDYQCASTSWGANLEPLFLLSRWANKKGGQSRWVNSDYTELVYSGKAENDDAKRLEKYIDAEDMLISSGAIAPCYWTGSIRFSYDYVKNFSDNVFDTTGMKYMYTSGR